MVSDTVILIDEIGFHARTAAIFSKRARKFKSKILVSFNNKVVDGKSMLAIMTLGVKSNELIDISVEGEDEASALATLLELVKNNFDVPPRHALSGTPASAGLVYGEAFLVQHKAEPIVIKQSCTNTAVEIDNLKKALELAKDQIAKVKQKMIGQISTHELEIYDAHIAIVQDSELIDKCIQLIAKDRLNADYALYSVVQEYIVQLEQVEDEYLKARVKDIDEVAQQVINVLQGNSNQAPKLSKPVILVAEEITTHQISAIDTTMLLGVITAKGGITDHTTILYRALGIPAVIGIGNGYKHIVNGSSIILDGENGLIKVNPEAEALKKFQIQQQYYLSEKQKNLASSKTPATTISGRLVKIYANIGSATDAREAAKQGADGVGLLRTEFCFLNRVSLPTEEEQYLLYKEMLDELPGKLVIIRLLDIGSDKRVPYIQIDEEENPALGTRALRLGFKHYEALLKPQIRAVLRLSNAYQIKLLFPLIATPQDLKDIKDAIIKETKQLEQEGIPVKTPIPMGIMVEVPNVALQPELFVDDIDFFSFGTNDLAQYLMAADRTNAAVSEYLVKATPTILKLIENVTKVAHAKGKWVGICGELASNTKLLEAFIRYGVDELSMPPSLIPTTKAFIRKMG